MIAKNFFCGFLNGWLWKNIPGTSYVDKIEGLDDLHVIRISKEQAKDFVYHRLKRNGGYWRSENLFSKGDLVELLNFIYAKDEKEGL